MPNIELHGYELPDAKKLRERIFQLFAGKPYVGEMVVGFAIVPSEVVDKVGLRQPFLRLLSTDREEAEEILGILEQKLPGTDIEYLKVERFIPKKQP